MRIPKTEQEEPTTYDYIIGMIEGCMPDDEDVVATEKLLDQLVKELSVSSIKELEALKMRLSLELNKGRIPEDTHELIELAADMDILVKAIKIVKNYNKKR